MLLSPNPLHMKVAALLFLVPVCLWSQDSILAKAERDTPTQATAPTAPECDDPASDNFESISDPAAVTLLQVSVSLPSANSVSESVVPVQEGGIIAKPLSVRWTACLFTISHLHMWQLEALYFIYSIICFWYELWGSAKPDQGRPVKERDGKIDFIRLIMITCIICEHISTGLRQVGPQNMNPILVPFSMPTFAILSGIVGASVDSKSMANVLCYTAGAIFFCDLILQPILACMTVGEWTYAPFFPPAFPPNQMDVKWYLWNLLVWRFTISPLFAIAEHFKLPRLTPFVLSVLTAYLLTCLVPFPMQSRHPLRLRTAFILAPFFAIGLLRPAKWWSAALEDRRLTISAIVFVFAWCIGYYGFPDFKNWASQDIEGKTLMLHPGLSFSNFHNLASLTLSHVGLPLAAMWILAAVHDGLNKMLPQRFMEVCVGCGSRTLYGYILHMYITVYIIVRAPLMVMPPLAQPGQTLLSAASVWFVCLVLGLHACFTFCCKLTEKLFGWLLMPFWIQRLIRFPFDVMSRGKDGGKADDSILG